MRIVGTIPHPVYLVTVFQMGERLALKVEHNLLELTFKKKKSLYEAEILSRVVDRDDGMIRRHPFDPRCWLVRLALHRRT